VRSQSLLRNLHVLLTYFTKGGRSAGEVCPKFWLTDKTPETPINSSVRSAVLTAQRKILSVNQVQNQGVAREKKGVADLKHESPSSPSPFSQIWEKGDRSLAPLARHRERDWG
jgi:hypothetical protein